jgi:hypothetical protein
MFSGVIALVSVPLGVSLTDRTNDVFGEFSQGPGASSALTSLLNLVLAVFRVGPLEQVGRVAAWRVVAGVQDVNIVVWPVLP